MKYKIDVILRLVFIKLLLNYIIDFKMQQMN